MYGTGELESGRPEKYSSNNPLAETIKPSKHFGIRGLLIFQIGSPHWKHSELFFKKKQHIPALKQLMDFN